MLPVFTLPKLTPDGVALSPEAAPPSALEAVLVAPTHPDRRKAARMRVSRPSNTPLRVATALARSSLFRESEDIT